MKQNLKDILENLSPRLKEAFYSDHTSNTIKDAANLGQLNSDTSTLNIIEGDVMDVLLGRARLDTLKETLKAHLNVSDTNLTIINKIIQDKIFGPLKDDLNQLKINQPEFTFQKVPQKEIIMPQKSLEISEGETIKTKRIEKTIEPSGPPKIKPITKEEVEQIIPEYSFPEPSKVMVEKPVSKMEELKKVVTPKVSSEQQEKIREKLLAAMQKKNDQPKIVEEMKKIFLKPKGAKKIEERKKVPRKIKIGELTSSEILSGKGEKFKDEKVFKKTGKEKPYILGAKLKEEKEKKERPDISEEPIPYKKYQKKNPFGKA